MKNRLSGKFALLDRTADSVIIGLVGGIVASDLSYAEIRYLASFYTDGRFLINGVNLLDKETRLSNVKLPQKNFDSILRITTTKLDGNMPAASYQKLLTEEADIGIEIIKGGQA